MRTIAGICPTGNASGKGFLLHYALPNLDGFPTIADGESSTTSLRSQANSSNKRNVGNGKVPSLCQRGTGWKPDPMARKTSTRFDH